MPSAQTFVSTLGLLATIIAVLYQPLYLRAKVFGLTRPQSGIANIHGLEALEIIPDTINCEDLHHHRVSNQIYTTCQDDEAQHLDWFPPIARFKDHTHLTTGSITVIDPKKFTSKKLKLDGFDGPFITHGIDVFSTPDEPTTVYIFAVNHLPNPKYYDVSASEPRSSYKARSQIEIFKHKIGSDTAEYIRTVRHPMIRTPNDLVATGLDGFYVTNDHYYPEGLMRSLEDLFTQSIAPWSNVVHVKIKDLKAKDPETGIETSIALDGIHNLNGLGHGHPNAPADIVLIDTSGGKMYRALRPLGAVSQPRLQQLDSFQLESTLDNPSYYFDEYASPANNASGYILAGLARAVVVSKIDLPDVPQPVLVWHLRGDTTPNDATMGGWTPHLVFQDDGSTVRTATTAIIVGIDPKHTNGVKRGWLFVTGFLARAVVAAKIDL